MLVTVTLNFNGGNEAPVLKRVAVNGTYGALPTPNMTGYRFLGWFTESNEGVASESVVSIPSNHTLHAQWTPSNYTVTFGVNGGDELKDPTKVVTFNNTYGSLPTPTRTGHRFFGWFTEGNESVTNETIVIIARNHTLIAQWEEISASQVNVPSSQTDSSSNKEVPSKYVEIVFETKSLTRKKVEEIISQYVKSADFTIVRLEVTKFEETKAIIKFIDAEEANEFVRMVKVTGRNSGGFIRSVSLIYGHFDIDSISSFFQPVEFFCFFV